MVFEDLTPAPLDEVLIAWLLALGGWAVFLWHYWFGPYYNAKSENGNRPLENARRQKEYERAVTEALKAGEPVQAAQDHRLRCQIRELDGLIKTYTDKAEDVRRILRTL